MIVIISGKWPHMDCYLTLRHLYHFCKKWLKMFEKGKIRRGKTLLKTFWTGLVNLFVNNLGIYNNCIRFWLPTWPMVMHNVYFEIKKIIKYLSCYFLVLFRWTIRKPFTRGIEYRSFHFDSCRDRSNTNGLNNSKFSPHFKRKEAEMSKL